MDSIKQVVGLVEEKLAILLENYTFLIDENKVLQQKINKLENQLSKEKEVFNELENKYQTLKIAKTIEGSAEENRETKLKINALIREVDNCIKQLSE